MDTKSRPPWHIPILGYPSLWREIVFILQINPEIFKNLLSYNDNWPESPQEAWKDMFWSRIV